MRTRYIPSGENTRCRLDEKEQAVGTDMPGRRLVVPHTARQAFPRNGHARRCAARYRQDGYGVRPMHLTNG